MMDYSAAIKSIGNSMTTYRDIENAQDAWKVLTVLSESVARQLRENGFRARTVQISIRDVNLSWQERQAGHSSRGAHRRRHHRRERPADA
jgi:DNA polymerase-4